MLQLGILALVCRKHLDMHFSSFFICSSSLLFWLFQIVYVMSSWTKRLVATHLRNWKLRRQIGCTIGVSLREPSITYMCTAVAWTPFSVIRLCGGYSKSCRVSDIATASEESAAKRCLSWAGRRPISKRDKGVKRWLVPFILHSGLFPPTGMLSKPTSMLCSHLYYTCSQTSIQPTPVKRYLQCTQLISNS